MKKLYTLFVVLIMVSATQTGWAESGTFTSTELITGANDIDGNTVTYKGEIVAAVMKRGEHSWVNLSDGYNAIGVWCTTGSLDNVKTIGNYKNEGDILEVTGVFHRACPMHGGELDIHADSVKIKAAGFPVEEHVSVHRVNLAIAFFILALLAIFMLRKRI